MRSYLPLSAFLELFVIQKKEIASGLVRRRSFQLHSVERLPQDRKCVLYFTTPKEESLRSISKNERFNKLVTKTIDLGEDILDRFHVGTK